MKHAAHTLSALGTMFIEWRGWCAKKPRLRDALVPIHRWVST